MSQQNTVKFATFGPNRGLSLFIGAYEFIDGICEVPEKDASSASSILTRYHDVCHAHELDQKIAEYDTGQQNHAAAASSNPQPETPPAKPAQPEKPAAQKPSDNPPEPKPETPPQPDAQKEQPELDAGNSGDADADAKKNGTGKKQPGKN